MIAEARAYVADLLGVVVPVPVFDYPPVTIAPPAVLLLADDPYVARETIGRGWTIGLRVQILYPSTGSGPHPVQNLDELTEHVLAAFADSPVVIGGIPRPRLDNDTAHVSLEVPVTIHWTD